MQLSSFLSQAVPNTIKKRLKRYWRVPDADWRLDCLASTGFEPGAVIDVGAYCGEWARTCKRHFPEAPILLVEPQEENIPLLDEFCRQYPDCEWRQCALGANRGKSHLVHEGSNSRILSSRNYRAGESNITDIELVPLQELVQDTRFASPGLVKIDTQGYELEVLRGAGGLTGSAEVIQLEMSVTPIGPVPDFFELLSFMDKAGYRVYDILELNYRPRHTALWQIDVIFARKDSSIIEAHVWK